MDLKQEPAMRELPNGTKAWHLNGVLHRIDGPAIERADGNKYWLLNGLLHRVDGPAVERINENKSWYIHGKRLTLMEFINHDLVLNETVQKVLTKWN